MSWLDNYITKNFRWREFFKSYTAKRLKINNVTKEKWVLNNIERLCVNILQPVRNEFGPVLITSGYRSSELNKAINGSVNSNHCIGCAADIEPLNENITLLDILEWIDANCKYRELIAEFYPDGWNHVAYRQDQNNYQLKLRDSNHFYDRVDVEYIKNIYGDM